MADEFHCPVDYCREVRDILEHPEAYFVGDSFTPTGMDDCCLLNRNFLAPEKGFHVKMSSRHLNIASGWQNLLNENQLRRDKQAFSNAAEALAMIVGRMDTGSYTCFDLLPGFAPIALWEWEHRSQRVVVRNRQPMMNLCV